MTQKIEYWYRLGLWTAEMVRFAAEKGIISTEDEKRILGEAISAPDA